MHELRCCLTGEVHNTTEYITPSSSCSKVLIVWAIVSSVLNVVLIVVIIIMHNQHDSTVTSLQEMGIRE